jgi:hypothetical protein
MQLLEFLERERVGRLDRDDAIEDVDGTIVLSNLVSPDRGCLEQLCDLLRRIRQSRSPTQLDVDHLGPATRRAVVALELCHRLEVRAVDVEQMPPGVRRVVRLLQHLAV